MMVRKSSLHMGEGLEVDSMKCTWGQAAICFTDQCWGQWKKTAGNESGHRCWVGYDDGSIAEGMLVSVTIKTVP